MFAATWVARKTIGNAIDECVAGAMSAPGQEQPCRLNMRLPAKSSSTKIQLNESRTSRHVGATPALVTCSPYRNGAKWSSMPLPDMKLRHFKRRIPTLAWTGFKSEESLPDAKGRKGASRSLGDLLADPVAAHMDFEPRTRGHSISASGPVLTPCRLTSE
jgi:hypothetical protein